MLTASCIRTWAEIRSMTWAASLGDKTPCAHAASTADEALSASAAVSIGGRSNATGRSRLGDNNRSRQSRSAVMSPSAAFSRSLRVIASDSPSSNASIARVVLLRAPFGRPFGLPLLPGLNGRPRCCFAVFSAGAQGISSMVTSNKEPPLAPAAYIEQIWNNKERNRGREPARWHCPLASLIAALRRRWQARRRIGRTLSRDELDLTALEMIYI